MNLRTTSFFRPRSWRSGRERRGFCASCAAKRIKGKIVLAKNDIYTPDDLANNWILTCQGHCFGPEVEITYDVV